MRAGLAIPALLIACAIARAHGAEGALQLPRVPVDQSCDAVAKTHGSRTDQPMYRAVLDHCVRDEQAAYETLRLIWDGLSDASKAACLPLARRDKYQYTMTRDCAVNRLNAEERERRIQAPPPAFRY